MGPLYRLEIHHTPDDPEFIHYHTYGVARRYQLSLLQQNTIARLYHYDIPHDQWILIRDEFSTTELIFPSIKPIPISQDLPDF